MTSGRRDQLDAPPARATAIGALSVAGAAAVGAASVASTTSLRCRPHHSAKEGSENVVRRADRSPPDDRITPPTNASSIALSTVAAAPATNTRLRAAGVTRESYSIILGVMSESEPRIRTLIHDLKNDKAIARIDAAMWPPIGTVVELASPTRNAVVIGVRLAVSADHTANVIIDVSDARPGDFISRHPADRLQQD